MAVVDRDRGYRELMRRIKKAGGTRSITVGIHTEAAGAGYSASGETVGDVASKHEFGIDVPERSFLRAWFDAEKDNLEDALQKLGESIVTGANTVSGGLEKTGLLFAADCQKFIQSDRVLPKTVKAEGTTLIDTGQLVGSISHKAEK